MATREQAQRPIRDLLQRLPRLPVTVSAEIDFEAADAEHLVAIAEDAETIVNMLQLGVGAIGHLLAHSAVVVEDGTISADCIESLGFLIAECGDFGAACLVLAMRCRRETSDYSVPSRFGSGSAS